MKIYKSEIPENYRISKYSPINYRDTFLCKTDAQNNISPDDLMVAFWGIKPRWLKILFKIRNVLVKPFGLKTGNQRNTNQLEAAVRNGNNYGFMSAVEKTENETIISLNDKHLIAYFSIYIENKGKEKDIYFTTLVKFHNKLGFVYFYAIRPFHKLVVKNMMKQAVNKISAVN